MILVGDMVGKFYQIEYSMTKTAGIHTMVDSNKFILVLEGGGAKGAYTAGIIDKLREYNLSYTKVAGTSAGALNAVAVATDKLDASAKLWKNLSIWNLLNFRGAGIESKFLQFLYAIFVTVPAIILNLFSSSFSSRVNSIEGVQKRQWMLSLAFYILNICISTLIGEVIFGRLAPIEYIIYSAFSGSLILQVLYRSPMSHFIWVFPMGGITIVACLVFGFVYEGARQLFYMIELLIITLVSGCILIEGPKRLFSLIDASFIRETLGDFFNSPMVMDCYVTFSYVAPILPFESSVGITDVQHPMALNLNAPFNLIRFLAHLPLYRKLNHLSLENKINSVVASAALPFGIISSIELSGKEFEDGGSADNCPVLRVLDTEVNDSILILLVNPVEGLGKRSLYSPEGQAYAKSRVREKMIKSLKARLGRAALRKFKRSECYKDGSDRIIQQCERSDDERMRIESLRDSIYRELLSAKWHLVEKYDNSRVVILAPEKKLGNFLTATLAFFPKKLKNFFDKGVNDGVAAQNLFENS